MKKNNRLMEILAVGLCLGFGAQAQEVRNGGDPNELATFIGKDGEYLDSWASVKEDLIMGLRLNQHRALDLKGMDADVFKEKALKALYNAKIQFDQNAIQVSDVDRPCENLSNSNGLLIHCNGNAYAAAMANYSAETQYQMVAHEYLSLAGLEPNINGASDYRFSAQISKNLRETFVKRWAVGEIVAERGFECELRSAGIPYLKNERRILIQIMRKKARMFISEFPKKFGTPGYGVAQDYVEYPLTSREEGKALEYLDGPNDVKYFSADLSTGLSQGYRVEITLRYDFKGSAAGRNSRFHVLKDHYVDRGIDLPCTPVDFEDDDFGLLGSHYYSKWMKPEEKEKLILRTMKRLASEQ